MNARADAAANLALIVMCSVVTILALTGRPPVVGDDPVSKDLLSVGELLPGFTDVEFSAADLTVLVIVRESCSFCTESLPFYRRLVSERGLQMPAARIVGVTVDPLEVGTAYLATAEVHVDSVVRMPTEVWRRIPGTPTILAVDRARTITGAWFGKLSTAGEREVLNAFSKGPQKLIASPRTE